MTELKLEVGKIYNNRKGVPVKIGSVVAFSTFPAKVPYNMDGRYNTGADGDFDLISEHNPPAATPQPATRTPLPHAELRHDHADGWDIEFLSFLGKWIYIKDPEWLLTVEYRRMPEPAPPLPNETIYREIMKNGSLSHYSFVTDIRGDKPTTTVRAIRIEFNPNDQSLVSATVVTL